MSAPIPTATLLTNSEAAELLYLYLGHTIKTWKCFLAHDRALSKAGENGYELMYDQDPRYYGSGKIHPLYRSYELAVFIHKRDPSAIEKLAKGNPRSNILEAEMPSKAADACVDVTCGFAMCVVVAIPKKLYKERCLSPADARKLANELWLAANTCETHKFDPESGELIPVDLDNGSDK